MSVSEVIIYNDLSCGYGNVLWQLQRDRNQLMEYGVSMSGASPDRFFGWLSHQSITRRLRHESVLENYNRQTLADSLLSMASLSDNKKLLIVTSCPWADALSALRARLSALPEFKKSRFAILCNVSPQWAVIEQTRRLPRLRSVRDAWFREWMNSDAMRIGQFLIDLQRVFGRPNVQCVESPAEIVPNPSSAYVRFCGLLQIPAAAPRATPPTKLCLMSRNTRQIFGDLITLNNVWDERMYPGILIETLREAETKLAGSTALDFRPMLSPAQTQEIESVCVRDNMVARAMFPAINLASKEEEKITQDGWSPWEGHDKKALDAILETLPDDFLLGMHETLAISHNRLDGEQRALFHALASRLPGKAPRKAENTAKVTVLVQTYNHEKYIGEALDSILAQKTDFGVEIVVLDDASSDNNRKVIREYAGRHANIRPVFLRSRSKSGECNSLLLTHARTPYVAICDGDDYFTDIHKLQTQADFLDAHPECSICFHPVRVTYEDGSPEHLYPSRQTIKSYDGRFTLDRLFGENFIQTNSVMYRWRFRDGLPAWFDPTLMPNDWYWHLLHAEIGKIGFIDKPMSVYRRHAKAIFWRKDKKSSVGHRRRYGMKELRFYEKILDHFGDKARDTIQMMANGVFSDFTQIYMESGDDAKLQKALRYFPKFGGNFLKSLDNINKEPV